MPVNRIVHKWTRKDREYLILLKLNYSRKFIASIFNYLLSRILLREGFQRGISAPALDAQYNEMKAGGKGHEIYANINGLSDSRMNIEYRDQLRDINDAARSLKLRLEPAKSITTRLTHGLNQRTQTNKARRVVRNHHTRRSSILDTSPVAAPIQHIAMSRRTSFADKISPFFANVTSPETLNPGLNASYSSANDTIPPALRITYDLSGNEARQRPLLLFRCAESPNNFRARRFQDPNAIIPRPEPFPSPNYREWAIHHLERSDVYPTPFISFAQRPRNAIKRVENIHSANFDNKRFLVIYSFNDIEANSAQNFGRGAGPHPVAALFKGEVSPLPDGYTGAGEWLAYGFVDCPPLVVLDAPQVVRLARAIRRFKSGDLTALTDIGAYLRTVPYKWREAVSYVILRNYIGEKLPTIGTAAYRQMMATIVRGTSMSTITLQDFERLSVTTNDADYEDEDESEDLYMITSAQGLSSSPKVVNTSYNTNGLVQVPVPVQSPSIFAPSQKCTTTILDNFNTRLEEPRHSDQTTLTTPLWSPDPAEVPASRHPVSMSLRDQVPSPSQHKETVHVDNDNEWDFVNNDLEEFFVTSFPSAAKRAEKLCTPTAHRNLFAGFDNEEEVEEQEQDDDEDDEEYVMPSIEVNRTHDTFLSSGRGNFLRGLTAHASSESPALETPSKPPRKVTSLRAQQGITNRTTMHPRNDDISTKQTKSSTLFEMPECVSTTRIPPPVFTSSRSIIDLTRLDTFQAQGTMTKPKASADQHRQLPPYPRPSAIVRTKVPVIVRKTIAYDSF